MTCGSVPGRRTSAAAQHLPSVHSTAVIRAQKALHSQRSRCSDPQPSLLQAETLDEAVSIVNNNEHGNGTALFTRSGPAARKFQNEVDVGMVSSYTLALHGKSVHHSPKSESQKQLGVTQ